MPHAGQLQQETLSAKGGSAAQQREAGREAAEDESIGRGLRGCSRTRNQGCTRQVGPTAKSKSHTLTLLPLAKCQEFLVGDRLKRQPSCSAKYVGSMTTEGQMQQPFRMSSNCSMISQAGENSPSYAQNI